MKPVTLLVCLALALALGLPACGRRTQEPATRGYSQIPERPLGVSTPVIPTKRPDTSVAGSDVPTLPAGPVKGIAARPLVGPPKRARASVDESR